MFFVSVLTSLFVNFLPETAGKALGNFDVSLNEEQEQQAQGHSLSIISGQKIVSTNSDQSPSEMNMVNRRSITHSEDQAEEAMIDDERVISSFEII